MVCEAFGCAPDVAERQDWRLVSRILTYRNARYAVDLFNDDRERLSNSPELMALLLEMKRAQFGQDYREDDLADDLAAKDAEDDEAGG